jgi:hypothetical protein
MIVQRQLFFAPTHHHFGPTTHRCRHVLLRVCLFDLSSEERGREEEQLPSQPYSPVLCLPRRGRIYLKAHIEKPSEKNATSTTLRWMNRLSRLSATETFLPLSSG